MRFGTGVMLSDWRTIYPSNSRMGRIHDHATSCNWGFNCILGTSYYICNSGSDPGTSDPAVGVPVDYVGRIMSGKIVYQPEQGTYCNKYMECVALPPTMNYPDGTRWQCDDCEVTWEKYTKKQESGLNFGMWRRWNG